MNRKLFCVCMMLVACALRATGQSIHFSQYYNTPLLLSPANTALTPENDMRVGLNYRNQWATIPVPFNTFSGWADFKIGGKGGSETANWLGAGIALFTDKAGDGNLSMNHIQGSLAYHLHLSSKTILSAGASAAYVGRSVNYDALTYDAQWDGHVFNSAMSNGEKLGIMRTSYYTVGGGLNFSWFPNEFVYCKLAGGLLNINNPDESFYGKSNPIGYRPIADLEVMFMTSPNIIMIPSAYFSTMRGAWELIAGSQFRIRLNGKNGSPTTLILGMFDRIGDAAIGVAGLEIGSIQFMANYDLTTSGLSPYNTAYGALEFSLIYQRPYQKNYGVKAMYSCPRF